RAHGRGPDRARLGGRRRVAPAARARDRGRAHRLAAHHALRDPGALPLPRVVPGERPRPHVLLPVDAQERARGVARAGAGDERGEGVRRLFLVLAPVALAACAVGPDWERPETAAPGGLACGAAGVTSVSTDEPWQRWWEVFKEPALDQLVKDARRDNQRLLAAFARVRAARALVVEQRAPLFPQASLNGEYLYERASRGTVSFAVSRD